MHALINRAVRRTKRYFEQFNYGGLLVGVMLFCISFMPSILPRPWLMQAIISGTSFAIGYGIGALLSKSLRWLLQREPSPRHKALAWRISYTFPFFMLLFVLQGHKWQSEVAVLVNKQPEGSLNIVSMLLVSCLTMIILLAIARATRSFARKLGSLLGRWLPRRVGLAIGAVLTCVLVIWIVNGVALKFFISTANSIYSSVNEATTPGIAQPSSTYRSGSSDSLISWQSLGTRGRDFVARGPSQEQLSQFSGQEAKESIRVYAGLDSAPTARTRAQLAVAELKRTHAFDRKVLVIATVTGSGWLEPQAVDSLEYMYNGNSAIVSQQYSYLPSWISFLVDSQNAKDAGTELYDAVYSEWASLPQNDRPKLIAYGLSLGSFGGQSAFSSAQDLRRSVDGALFQGTPSNTDLWSKITNNRDKGSPQILPVYDSGKIVRFAANRSDIDANQSGWSGSRTLYMQHPSDPVIWWSFDLILHKPDRLREPRGGDVSPKTRWIPIVTFLQATVDQFYGVSVPNGHGHNYADSVVAAWAAVTQPENWTAQKTDSLQAIINTYQNE